MKSETKQNSIAGILVSILLIVVISVIAFTVYLKSTGYDFASLSIKDAINYIKQDSVLEKTSISEITFSQDGSVDCKVYKDYTIVLSKDGIKWYDRRGKLVQENTFTLIKPVLRCSNKYMAVVDISGRDVYFYKDKTLLWTRKLNDQIINANVSDSGYCTVVTQSKEFKSAVLVIDINGVEKYTKLCAEDIVVSAKTLHDGHDVLINKLITANVKTGTQFEFNNIYEEKPYATINISDAIMPIILSYGDNELAVGQNMLLFMDKQGKEVWRKNADSIFCVAPNSSKYVIVAGKFTNDSGVTKEQIVSLNSKGREVYSFEQPENISGIHFYNGRLALRTKRSIYLYTLSGKKLGQYSAKREIEDAYLIGNNEVIVISGGSISLEKIKG